METQNLWYDPKTGQFTTADPIGLASGETNLYGYASGDPINLSDPSGLCSIAPWKADSCLAEPAAKILDGVTGGISTQLAGEAFGFDPACTGWSDINIGLAAGFVGFGKFKTAARAARKTDRIKEHVTHRDLDAARRELDGEVVARRADGTPYDHVDEVRNAQRGLANRIDVLNRRLGNPNLTAAERADMQAELGEASRLLDHTEGYVPR